MATCMTSDGAKTDTVARSTIAGLVGGLVGSWTMNQFQALWTWIAEGDDRPQSAGGKHDSREWQERNEDTNATEVLAQAIAVRVIDRPLNKEELRIAGPAVHYGYGAIMGGVYGALAARSRRVRALGGTGYGVALWAIGDELAVPTFGLSKPHPEYPLQTHVQALAAHVVYGVTTEMVRRGVRAVLH